MPGVMKLTYFDLLGRAEPTRLLFKLAGKEFIDNRLSRESWQQFKPTTPKGEIPVLEVDGKMLCESNAIARYVARKCNLYGANNMEAAVIDMIFDSTSSVYEPAATAKFTNSDEAKAEALTKLSAALDSLEKIVVLEKKGRFILGDNATLADTMVYAVLEWCQLVLPDDFKCDPASTVAQLAKSFSEIPAVAEWIRTRPKNSM